MSATELLVLITQGFFILLSVLTGIAMLRHRDALRRDIFLMFAAQAVPFYMQVLAPLYVTTSSTDTLIAIWFFGWCAFTAQPYLQLRLVRYFRPLPLWISRAAFVTMLIYWGLVYTHIAQPTRWITYLMVAYFAVLDSYAVVSFVRGALTSSGVIRVRLRFAALGSALMTVILLLTAAQSLDPTFIPDITLNLVLAISSALCYYVAFVPPRWLRQVWQLRELRSFLLHSAISQATAAEKARSAALHQDLCQAAMSTMNGSAAAIVDQNPSSGVWSVRWISDPAAQPLISDGAAAFAEAWRKRQPLALRRLRQQSSEANGKQLLDKMQAEMALLAPIATDSHAWGLLIVFLRHGSLFIEDDLNMLGLLAQHSAIVLENNLLVEELRGYSQQLEHTVEQRTASLKESEERYRQIVETAQEGIWVLNAGHKTQFANPKMAEMLGYSIAEIEALPLSALLDGASASSAIVDPASGHFAQLSQHEVKLKRKDGAEVWTLISTSELPIDKEQEHGVMAMVVDISGRKHNEEEIRRLNAQLEQRVADRTAELSMVNRELEAFSYSVSHDLRAPLRAMNGFSQALIDDYSPVLDKHAQNYLDRICTASQRMGVLIDDLLQLSQISKVSLRLKEVNLSQLAREIIADLKESQPDRQIEIRIEEGLQARGDEGLLRVVLNNLLGNAWKYSRKQSAPVIEFGATRQEGKNSYYVRDNGAGFDMAYVDKLFGAFQRLHTSNEFEGTGIGLATVQRILHRHSGRIWVDAAVDQGATFYFTLP